MLKKLKNAFLSCLIVVLSTQLTLARDWQFDDVGRVVALADIHGAYDAMTATLQQAGIIDSELAWAGGDAHLVIVGDILDRGPKSRAAMELLMRIEGEASAAGGNVHVLIGNHESMLLTGDMRYVSAAEYAAFADEEDAAERAHWFELFVERQNGQADELQSVFDKKFPVGYFAMRRAFRADGRYGSWLLGKNIIALINGTAFVHGGLPPSVASLGLDGVNQQLQQDLVTYVEALATLTDAAVLLPTDSHYEYLDLLNNFLPALDLDAEVIMAISTAKRMDDSVLLSADGPLWNRSNVTCPQVVEEHRLEAVLAAIGAGRVVVGHTPTPNREVLQRFGGRLIEIDTGMLGSYYNGSGNALVLEDGAVSVVNQSGVAASIPMDHPRQVGRRPGELTPPELQALLENGNIEVLEKDGSRSLARVSDGENTVSAIFHKRSGKGIYPGVAAYRMDRLLGLDMVPVTARRKVGGADGSLQFMPGNSTDEAARSASGQGVGATCAIADQWAAMYIFDVLIYNEGRSLQRMMYDASSWRLILSEHDRAFGNKKGRPAHLKSAQISVSEGWKRVLSRLTDEVLQQQLGDVLDKRRLRSLMARRDELLAT